MSDVINIIDISAYRKMNEQQIRSQPEKDVLDVARFLNEKTKNQLTNKTFYTSKELKENPYDAAIALLVMEL